MLATTAESHTATLVPYIYQTQHTLCALLLESVSQNFPFLPPGQCWFFSMHCCPTCLSFLKQNMASWKVRSAQQMCILSKQFEIVNDENDETILHLNICSSSLRKCTEVEDWFFFFFLSPATDRKYWFVKNNIPPALTNISIHENKHAIPTTRERHGILHKKISCQL